MFSLILILFFSFACSWYLIMEAVRFRPIQCRSFHVVICLYLFFYYQRYWTDSLIQISCLIHRPFYCDFICSICLSFYLIFSLLYQSLSFFHQLNYEKYYQILSFFYLSFELLRYLYWKMIFLNKIFFPNFSSFSWLFFLVLHSVLNNFF